MNQNAKLFLVAVILYFASWVWVDLGIKILTK